MIVFPVIVILLLPILLYVYLLRRFLPGRSELTMPEADGPFEFPKTFLWGSGLSVHLAGRCSGCDWTQFEKKVLREGNFDREAESHALPGHIYNLGANTPAVLRNRSGLHRFYERDFRMASLMNLSAMQISLCWGSLFPRENMKNPDSATASYWKNLIQSLKRNRMEPVICLSHFSAPAWFHEKKNQVSGWERPDALDHWKKYVAAVLEITGKDASRFITFHEPVQHVYNSYIEGIFPPNEMRDLEQTDAIFAAMVRAHAAAYDQIKAWGARNGRATRVGISLHTRSFEAFRPLAPQDLWSAWLTEKSFVWDFPDALITGRLKLLHSHFQETIREAARSLDFIAIGYYGRYFCKTPLTRPEEMRLIPDAGRAGMPPYPMGLRKIILAAWRKYRLPVIVTGGGVADSEMEDTLREHMLVCQIKEIWHAMKDGAVVEGYLPWALLDQNDFAEGFENRYGFISVNHTHGFRRSPRGSSSVYTNIAASGALSPTAWRKTKAALV